MADVTDITIDATARGTPYVIHHDAVLQLAALPSHHAGEDSCRQARITQ